ncbi:uncharacterized protein An03g02290 [Aspergillus niger]|uniref:Contig An03c0070, genomic contig n=2 Tax=Aspergillus niger TaxID=5061 RepID=A2QG88_ASPNC|nr:uncharacterized protein An03g02290 [Aspergillus niger]CAK38198.1 unnamed protein product [Aspergillus niger]
MWTRLVITGFGWFALLRLLLCLAFVYPHTITSQIRHLSPLEQPRFRTASIFILARISSPRTTMQADCTSGAPISSGGRGGRGGGRGRGGRCGRGKRRGTMRAQVSYIGKHMMRGIDLYDQAMRRGRHQGRLHNQQNQHHHHQPQQQQQLQEQQQQQQQQGEQRQQQPQ